MAEFYYQDPFPMGEDKTEYEKIEGSEKYVSVDQFNGQEVLKVVPEALTVISNTSFRDGSFLLRREHNEQVAAILADPEASANEKGVAMAFLRNAEVSSEFILPFCQDTGTAIVFAKKGENVFTGANDAEFLSKGAFKTYQEENLRHSQTVAFDMYTEKNNGMNMPAQVDIMAEQGNEYKFLFVIKGGGSANKSFLYQETKALLTPEKLEAFMIEKMKSIGTAACPPYHLSFVIGGCSAEQVMKTVKLSTARYYDGLPTEGNEHGVAFRDIELEKKMQKIAQDLGIGAQFGGKYFTHDIRIIRLPRHGASCPVGLAVSCSADRNIKAKITKDGLFVEKLDRNPGDLIPEQYRGSKSGHGVKINLNQPMEDILAEMTKHPVGTMLSLNGTIIVGRDIAHAKFKELIDAGKDLPEYLKNHPIYYAGPAKKPDSKPSGSFGPTTAGRMDPYVDLLQSRGGSMVMIAKGNRSQQVTDACKKHGGFYLGSIGGPAALLAEENIKSVECIDYPEQGMEAVWKIEVEDFPAFILVDDKGNDFYADLLS